MEPESPRASRLPVVALLLLGGAVLVGATAFGAPPRMRAPGASEPWRTLLESLAPLALLEAAVAVSLGLLLVTGCLRREAPVLAGGRAALRAHRPLLLLLLLGLLHAVPLPAGALAVTAPYSAEVYGALTAVGDDTWRPRTLWPTGTFHALFCVAGVLAASAATWAVVRDRARSGRAATGPGVALLAGVALVGTAAGVYGLTETFFGDDRILGLAKVSNKGHVTGPFIHRTMLAVWAGMGIAAALGLAGRSLALSREKRRLPAPVVVSLCLAGVVVQAAAAFFSLSRLGFVAAVAGAVVTLVLLAVGTGRGGGRRRIAAVGLALLVAAGAAAAVVRSAAFRERMEHLVRGGDLTDPRLPAWDATVDLFMQAPVLGTGIGSFGRAIHLTQSVDSPQELWFAHSDPLNLLSDAGVVGGALVLWWFLVLLRRGLPALRDDTPGVRPLVAAALGGAVVVMAASLGDFQTQFPVVALPFAALLTLPAALADGARGPREDEQGIAATTPWLLPPAGLAAVAGTLVLGIAALPAQAAWRRATAAEGEFRPAATPAEGLLARGKARMETARAALRNGGGTAELEEAEALLREATRQDPLLDEAHMWLGITSLFLRREREDVLRSLGRARLVSRGHAAVNLVLGETYLALLGTEPAPHGPPDDSALAALREASALDPAAFSAAWATARARGLSPEELERMVPDRAHALITLGDHARREGREADALAAYLRALDDEPWNPAAARRSADLFLAGGREAEGRSELEKRGATWPGGR